MIPSSLRSAQRRLLSNPSIPCQTIEHPIRPLLYSVPLLPSRNPATLSLVYILDHPPVSGRVFIQPVGVSPVASGSLGHTWGSERGVESFLLSYPEQCGFWPYEEDPSDSDPSEQHETRPIRSSSSI
ncbi:hypothetical protein RSAG8_08774, partial [Rhizoctonia solani AG-8 WAC10335]